MKSHGCLFLKTFLLIYFLFVFSVNAEECIDVNQDVAMRIGVKIWYNECNGKISGLTSWNDGEKFASLGIGHFNWYPNLREGSEKDGFPQLIKYMERFGVTVPIWLQGEKVPPCPWQSRAEFLESKDSPRMQELRQFLVDTIPIQAQFMVHRLFTVLPKILQCEYSDDHQYIYEQFNRLSQSPRGIYALVDYVNFKGEGVGWFAAHKTGWGLLQVLEGMKFAPVGMPPLEAFVWSANRALTERVYRASPTSHEHKWLPGWRKRILTYLE